MIINAPVIDAMIPKMHLGPIFSPRKRKAPEVVKTGFMSMIAVASANPTFEMLKNNKQVAAIKTTERNN